MRLSIILLIFLILLNGWAGVLQEYDIDEHVGINAETGEHEELEQAQSDAENVGAGTGGIFGSIVGLVSTMFNQLGALVNGLNPAAQLLTNVVPPGIGESLILWGFGVMEIIIAIDLMNYARGVG